MWGTVREVVLIGVRLFIEVRVRIGNIKFVVLNQETSMANDE